ncbi:MAG: hypothetical protein LUF92_03725 [Clostridiales bacterium]|nr:hypothetical protein [Clostridiales bacterium]
MLPYTTHKREGIIINKSCEEKLTLKKVKELGFTDKLIQELLSEPELVQNPYYRHAAPMKLFVKDDVYKAMKDDRFIIAQEKRLKRQEAAKKAVETKTNKLRKEFDSLQENIVVKRIPMQKLKKRTLENKQDWYDYQRELRDYVDEYYNAYEADEETVNRWMVNYIRHNMTSYDDGIYELHGRVGRHDVFKEFHISILKKIETVYPELKDECENQIAKKLGDVA